MRFGGTLFRSLAVCGLTAAALLACGVTAHAQTTTSKIGGGSTGMSTGGSGLSGGGGLSGGSSASSQNYSFAGSSNFAGSSGSASGSSFAGSTGSSFSGSSGSFSGTSGTGSYTGSGSSGRGSSSIGGVSSMNAFASSYANPIAGGIGTSSGSTTSSTAFGTPLYSSLVTNPTKIIGSTSGSSGGLIGNSGSGMLGSASTRGGLSGGLGGSGYGQSGSTTGDYGIFALPNVVASNSRYPAGSSGPAVFPGGTAAPAKLAALPPQMQTDLQTLIGRSDGISAATRSAITLGVDPTGTIVLRGAVTSPNEARSLERLLRFAPGVSAVRNELTLKGP